MRIDDAVIVGAGAMGSLFAARMALAGIRTTLVDVDQERLAIIKREGLRLIQDGHERTAAVDACLAGHIVEPPDLVVVFTKGVHTRAAAASVAHLAAGHPAVLTLQNGVGNAELIAGSFAPEHIVVGTAHVPADLQAPNVVVSSGFAHLAIGDFRARQNGRANDVAHALRRAGFETEVVADIERAIWEKLAFNAALNPLAMVTGCSNGGLDNLAAKRIARQLLDEALDVFAERGDRLDRDAIWRTIEHALAGHAHHKASMLQDREAGRATEIEFINGAIVREGERRGVPTPANALVRDLVEVIELNAGRRLAPAPV